jgi:hypothetical protein
MMAPNLQYQSPKAGGSNDHHFVPDAWFQCALADAWTGDKDAFDCDGNPEVPTVFWRIFSGFVQDSEAVVD